MRAATETNRINRMLGAYGLGSLDDRGTIAQLGFLIQDHDHFRELLNASEPRERANMYNALRPNLRFEAKPLDVYVAELGDLAERKQLPTVTPDGGLAPFQVPQFEDKDEATLERDYIAPAVAAADKAMAEELARVNATMAAEFAAKHLELTCAQCTKTEIFHGTFKDDCVRAARLAGWSYNWETNQELCPQHA